MEAVSQTENSNDYAVARELNLRVMSMIMSIFLADNAGLSANTEMQELNHTYILLVEELRKLYEKNSVLSTIKPEPIWKRFDVLKASTREIIKHIASPDNDYGSAHYARVEKLCILANVETPHFTPGQKRLNDNAEKILKDCYKKINDAYSRNRAKEDDDWQISKYTISYKPDGTTLINNVLKLKKAHAGSTTERLLEQALKSPNVLFKPDLGKTARNLSTILHSAGFTPILRQLFFPIVSESKGIVFRPTITRAQADAENISTKELDLALKGLGAITEPKSSK